jgi:hypothetical protein
MVQLGWLHAVKMIYGDIHQGWGLLAGHYATVGGFEGTVYEQQFLWDSITHPRLGEAEIYNVTDDAAAGIH